MGNSGGVRFSQTSERRTGHRVSPGEITEKPYLLIEGDGVLFLIPTNNIKYIQAYPAPSKLSNTAIRGQRFGDVAPGSAVQPGIHIRCCQKVKRGPR
jgi:hypothetical protein